MKFLDAAYIGGVDTFAAVLDHEQADDFAYYVGGNYALHAWAGADVIALRTSTRRGMGIHVSTVAGRDGAADGAYFAQLNLQGFGASPGDRFCWDLEPGIYRADPAAALAYGKAWAGAVRAVAAVAELAPLPPVPRRRILHRNRFLLERSRDHVVLECGHHLWHHRRTDWRALWPGDFFDCHDCAMEGRR